MLLVGHHRTRTCQGVTRRELLQVGGSAVLGLSLFDRLGRPGRANVESQARVKSVLLLWLWGGPAHLDTFDPKPAAPAEFRGPQVTLVHQLFLVPYIIVKRRIGEPELPGDVL